MGLADTAKPLWLSAASLDERIAPLLDSLGHAAEAAMHRVSAASCFEQVGEYSRAANLYRAALAGPLSALRQTEVQRMLDDCLRRLGDAELQVVA
jgi:hypothetical protein